MRQPDTEPGNARAAFSVLFFAVFNEGRRKVDRGPLLFNHAADFLCALSELFLKSTNQFVVLAFSVLEIIIS
jgi:hypothetical protein